MEVKAIAADAKDVISVIADVSDRNSVQELANVSYATFGQVDLLMNNAGIDGGRQGPLADVGKLELQVTAFYVCM